MLYELVKTYTLVIAACLVCGGIFFMASCEKKNVIVKNLMANKSHNKPQIVGLAPASLRCEYHADPLGIDVAKPRLSWALQSDQRSQRQTAYRIVVADSKESLMADTGNLWDTGKVDSDKSIHVVYDGEHLSSRLQCYWKVRVWDKDGLAGRWSKIASWDMGLLDAKDWQAKWIGYDAPWQNLDSSLVLPPPPYLRKDFSVDKPIKRAVAYASALGLYELHINGQRVGQDYFTPGWTNYGKRVYYQSYDVTDLVGQGGNAVGAILGDGWYAGYIGPNRKRNFYGKEPRLLVQLEIEYEDGSGQTLITDKSWKAGYGPELEADFLMGETYDARKEMPGWDKPDFDDSKWASAAVSDNIKSVLQAYPGVTVKKTQEITPVTRNEPVPGVFVFNLGQNFAGCARLKVKGQANDKITLRFAERLNPDGTIYTKNLRGARCTDTYICRGGGVEIWQPRFTFHGFQYVEVTGYPSEPPMDAITGIVVHSDTPKVGSFECSDEMVNQLYRNITWGQRSNFIEIPTDCPQRDERLGWTGDAQIFIRTATYNMDVASFFTKWLVDLEDAQSSDGAFFDIVPRVPRVVTMGGGVAAWGDAGVICPWTIYHVYADTRVIEKHYNSMQRWIKYLQQHSENLLRPAEGYGDWVSIESDTPKDVIATAFFAYSTHLLSQAAVVLGKTEDAKEYNELFERIRQAFNQAYVSEDGRVKGDTQTCYLLALWFDLLPPEKRQPAAKRLVEKIKDKGWHLSTGFVGLGYLLPTLTQTGYTDIAYRLLRQDTFPSWGYSIKHGATTIWERWDGWTQEKGFQDPGMNSFNHYAFGSVGQWIFSTVAGIDTDGPGYKKIIIRPRPGGGLTYARAEFLSMHGQIKSDWQTDNDTFKLDITIPPNTTAMVYIPTLSADDITESGISADKADGLHFIKMEAGSAVYLVQSGKYAFVSKYFTKNDIN